MLTVNQTKRFCSTNQYWIAYRNFEYKYPKNYKINNREGETRTWQANEHFYHAYKELRRLGIKETQILTSGQFPTIYRDDIKFRACVRMQSDGEWICRIDGAHTDEGSFNHLPFTDSEYSIHFNLKGNITEENIIKQCQEQLNKYLFPKGLFREWQEFKLWTKRFLKLVHKRNLEEKYEEIDNEAIYKWVKKHFKLIPGDQISDDEFFKAAKKIGKQSKQTVVNKYDYSWVFDYDGDIDEIESEFYKREPEQRTIYIN